MSYILDALKKLENEKARKSRGAGMLGISGELFRDDRHSHSGGNIWKIVAVVLVASLVTFGATWFFLKTGKPGDTAKLNTKTPVSPPGTVAPPPDRKEVRPVVPVVKTDAPTAVVHKGKRQKTPKKQAIVTEQPVVPASPPPADIMVSGIAWQDEHSARRAVVNGFLMQEGGSVSGAKITEIYKDRVRFTMDGRVFEVHMQAAGFPGTAK